MTKHTTLICIAALISCGSCRTSFDLERHAPHWVHGPFTEITLDAHGDEWTTEYPPVSREDPTQGQATWSFDELLPSWNVELPDGAAFRVEVAVARVPGAELSPWLDLGGWGPWPADDRAVVEFDGGRVEVDVLVLDDPLGYARLRLRTRGGAPGETLRIQDLRVTLTNRSMIAPALRIGDALHSMPKYELRAQAAAWAEAQNAPLPSSWPPEPLELRLRHQYSESPELGPRICSPTSVAMVLEYGGVDLPTREVAELLYDAEHDIYGNWNRAVQGAFVLGVPGHLARLSSWYEVLALLGEGHPLVLSIGAEDGQLAGAPYARTDGHLIVLVGLNLEGAAIVLDPATPTGDEAARRYALDELEVVWMERGGVVYVIGGSRENR